MKITTLLPCGHTDAQGAWLGCTNEECRPRDRQISDAYWGERGGMPASVRDRAAGNVYTYALDAKSERRALQEGQPLKEYIPDNLEPPEDDCE